MAPHKPKPDIFISVLSLTALIASMLLAVRQPLLFEPYFGGIPPMPAIAAICLSGWPALYFLNRHRYFLVSQAGMRLQGMVAAIVLAIPFMILVTVADLAMRFPREINVPLPTALLFYPVMAYVVGLCLHAVPLAILVPVSGRILSVLSVRHRIWLCICIVACLEATFQAINSPIDSVLSLFVAIHLFSFGVIELLIFRRYDFVSMYVFRVVYYGYWHLAWGYLRLEWLF